MQLIRVGMSLLSSTVTAVPVCDFGYHWKSSQRTRITLHRAADRCYLYELVVQTSFVLLYTTGVYFTSERDNLLEFRGWKRLPVERNTRISLTAAKLIRRGSIKWSRVDIIRRCALKRIDHDRTTSMCLVILY